MKKFIVLFAAFAMVFAFAPVATADVEVYGSARFRTYSADVDPQVAGTSSDRDTEWRIGHLTRFGAKFAAGDVTGRYEIDARGGAAGATGNIESDAGASRLGNLRLRLAYGEWNFGSGKLLVGQNYPLFDAAVSGVNYLSGGLMPYGGIGYSDARTSQIRLTFGNLKIAFLPTDTSVLNGTAAVTDSGGDTITAANAANTAGFTDVDVSTPKVEVRYGLDLGPGKIDLIGGYQTYDIDATVNGGKSVDVTSFVTAVRGKFNFEALYFNFGLSYRENGGPYDAWTVVDETPAFNATNTDLIDVETIGVVGALGFKLSDTCTLEASYSKLMSDQGGTLTNEDDAQAYAFMAKFTMAPGVYIIPELLILDNEDVVVNGVSANQSETTVFGVFWRIDFK